MIKITVDYPAGPGETVYVSVHTLDPGIWDDTNVIAMVLVADTLWELEMPAKELHYSYLVKTENGDIVKKEWGRPHSIFPDSARDYVIKDLWQEPQQRYLYTSAFTGVFFAHEADYEIKYYTSTLLLTVYCPYVRKGQILKICGSPDLLGGWMPDRGLRMSYAGDAVWRISLDASQLNSEQQYKFIICDEVTGECLHWEEGPNRFLMSGNVQNFVYIENLEYRHADIFWYGAGVSIPVFSLRTKESFGIGEFSDLKKLIDWAALTGQKVIQILPVNDTTTTFSWRDSYPYNAISIYALHPVYLGLNEHPLKDGNLMAQYRKHAEYLNRQEKVDYDSVIRLKQDYFKDLFAEKGSEILNSNAFHSFYIQNREWLFPYACFSYFRDIHQTADYTKWGEHHVYNREALELLVLHKEIGVQINFVYFIQFLLHQQLTDVKVYAHSKGVVLKGDIPIGISRYSVEAWTEPHLFHLDMQTGAPPDAFAVFGQNWGFPTYNWEEMAKDDYSWWKKRFGKMSDYFDAYRIDHILGFFRIWEIPRSSVQGLLGHFSPAFPLSAKEILRSGIGFSPELAQPYIHASFLPKIFGEYTEEVMLSGYLEEKENGLFRLADTCDDQYKIKQLFKDKTGEKNNIIREGLYRLCNEVLFIKDNKETDRYHPRIMARTSHAFGQLTDEEAEKYNDMHEDFFYHRHTEFWKEQAMRKLPALLSATSMLPCGEDLGMTPASVPAVMQELQILSLEIERWPKEHSLFADLSKLPYLSVCSTSTHDMSPIRLWWTEDAKKTQQYYNLALGRTGTAPKECTPEICRQIVSNHLKSTSMLVILPMQDWMSIDAKTRKPDAASERINDPANPLQYWQYRMHVTMEELLEDEKLNRQITELICSGKRGTL